MKACIHRSLRLVLAKSEFGDFSMSVRVSNFLGRDISIPEDRLYDPIEGLWVKERENGSLELGITEPSVLMSGTLRQVEPLLEAGTMVQPGETVILALTSKLKYIAVPISGIISFPTFSADMTQGLADDPYSVPLFFIVPSGKSFHGLADATHYADSLQNSEGTRNPHGRKGGVSPTCKAVYMGLSEQKLQRDTD
jgi:glycine cleavage system H lipoate-binding protein